MKKALYLMLALLLASFSTPRAQVTFGSMDDPHTFSVLELISNQKKGLRLSQMTSAQRDAMTATSDFRNNKTGAARGLSIYNTTIDCVEYWNGTNWVNTCGKASQPAADSVTFSPTYNTFAANTDLFTDAVLVGGMGDDRTRGTGILYTDIDAGVFNYTGGEGQILHELSFHHPSGLSVVIPSQSLAGTPTTPASGQITILVSGIPSAAYAGKAFDIPITLLGRNLTVRVNIGCGAYIGDKLATTNNIADNWLQFQCYNLGASNTIDLFTPDQYLHGAKYRFGAKEASLTMVEDQYSAYNASVPNWNSKPIEEGVDEDWTPDNNPCPAGWRLPTQTEWEQVTATANNTQTPVGTWTDDAANYSSGRKFGDALFLPAVGYRGNTKGTLYSRGNLSFYWSSTTYNSGYGYHMNFNTDNSKMYYGYRTHGFSVRCVAE